MDDDLSWWFGDGFDTIAGGAGLDYVRISDDNFASPPRPTEPRYKKPHVASPVDAYYLISHNESLLQLRFDAAIAPSSTPAFIPDAPSFFPFSLQNGFISYDPAELVSDVLSS